MINDTYTYNAMIRNANDTYTYMNTCMYVYMTRIYVRYVYIYEYINIVFYVGLLCKRDL